MTRRLLELAALIGATEVLLGLMVIGSAAALAADPLTWFSYGPAVLSTLAPCAWTRIPPDANTTAPAGRAGKANDAPTEDTPC